MHTACAPCACSHAASFPGRAPLSHLPALNAQAGSDTCLPTTPGSLPPVSELNPLLIPLTGFEDMSLADRAPSRMLSSNPESFGSQPNKPEAEDVSMRAKQRA